MASTIPFFLTWEFTIWLSSLGVTVDISIDRDQGDLPDFHGLRSAPVLGYEMQLLYYTMPETGEAWKYLPRW